jgi:hypothetical protein
VTYRTPIAGGSRGRSTAARRLAAGSTVRRRDPTDQPPIVALLDTVGNALILQLAFLAFSVPIVTAFPAAVALQRQLADQQRGQRTGFGTFGREFVRSWRSSWQLGILAPIVAIGFVVAIPFWYSASFPFARAGLGVLVCLLGLACGVYLNVLRAAEAARPSRWPDWLATGFGHLVRHPLRSLWGLVLLFAWLVTLAYVPTLVLVGSGLMPALIVRYSLTPRVAGQAMRS